MIEKKTALTEDELSSISGGVSTPGAAMVCTVPAALYSSNPAGSHFRSTSGTLDTVQPGAVARLYEYGTQYCKVVCNGKVGWIETAALANK